MSILDEASGLINGERAETYGPVADNFKRIAELWMAYLGDWEDVEDLNLYDVANMMILVKLARIKNAGYHRDSYADIAGYAALSEKVAQSSAPVSQEFWDDIDAGIVEAQEKRERDTTSRPPRVWGSLADVPTDVKVLSNGGAAWSYYPEEGHDGMWLWTHALRPSFGFDKTPPFTEMLDIEPKGSE